MIMSEAAECVEHIITCVNNEVCDLESNDRCMVLLLVSEIVKCSVKLDIFNTYKERGKAVDIEDEDEDDGVYRTA